MKTHRASRYVVWFVVVGSLIVMLHLTSLDGIQGRILNVILDTDTEFARGYSDDAFRELRPGQEQNDVVALLGEPLYRVPISSTDKERGMYSRSPRSTHYLYREIEITHGKVSQKRHHFYVD